MIVRLDELEVDLIARRGRAHREGWLGEIEGIDLTLNHLRGKRDQTRRLARATCLVEPDTLNPRRPIPLNTSPDFRAATPRSPGERNAAALLGL